jgi:hypothetical protein
VTWWLAATATGAALACTEPRVQQQTTPEPAAALAARIDLSDSLAPVGAPVRMTVRLVGASFASATARIQFDTTGLTYVGETAAEDGATRLVNAEPGVVRVATIAPGGVPAGRVVDLDFVVRRRTALQSARLLVDEVHGVNGADLLPTLRAGRP